MLLNKIVSTSSFPPTSPRGRKFFLNTNFQGHLEGLNYSVSFTQHALVSLNNKTAWDPRQSIGNLIKRVFFDQLEIAASTLVMHHKQHDSPYTSHYKISKIIFSE